MAHSCCNALKLFTKISYLYGCIPFCHNTLQMIQREAKRNYIDNFFYDAILYINANQIWPSRGTQSSTHSQTLCYDKCKSHESLFFVTFGLDLKNVNACHGERKVTFLIGLSFLAIFR